MDTTIFGSLQEQSRPNITNALWKFTDVDNQEALQNGGLERYKKVNKVVRLKFKKGVFPEAFIREVVDELYSPGGEAGMLRAFIDTTSVEDSRWGPRVVDGGWHPVCQAILMGVEGAEWEMLYRKFQEKNIEINVRNPGGSNRAWMLW